MPVTLAGAAPAQPVLSSDRRQKIVVVADDAGELEPVAKHLRGLALAGHRVVLMWWHGEPGPRLAQFGARVRIRPSPSPRGDVRGRLVDVLAAVRASPRLGAPGPLVGALRRDRRAVRTLRSADAVILAGVRAQAAADDLTTPTRPAVPQEELDRWEVVGGVWRRLAAEVAAGRSGITPRYVRSLLRQVRLLGGRVSASRQPLLVPVVETMHRMGRFDLADEVARLLDPDEDGLDPGDRAQRRGLQVLTQMSASGVPPEGFLDAAGELVRAADDALGREDVERTVDLSSLALFLLFHRELHADGGSSPLVDDPDAFLADWRGSRVGALLAGPCPRRPVLASRARAPHGQQTRPRVVVVPGSYPQFSVPVVDALAERAEVRVVDSAARPGMRGLGAWRDPVDARLRQALGSTRVPDYEVLEEMEAARAVFVDWADRGAMATVMAVPEGVRLVLRIHSMDALSPWVHLLDWSRVDDLVVVSEPIRRLVDRLVGDRLSGTRVHVVPNVLDPGRIPTEKTQGHLRRLIMVGWGQQVKDPLWALEVLAALRSEDPSWRLSLLGTDFPDDPVRSQRDYARRFRQRLTQDDVRGAVDIEGFTRDVAPHLAASGFVLSTSRRESFGLGLVEAAASGAVPVVRDWPIFAPLDAARSLFPAHWVVGSVAEAVARIRSAAQEPQWLQASAEARRVVAERFSSGDARACFQDVVLGAR